MYNSCILAESDCVLCSDGRFLYFVNAEVGPQHHLVNLPDMPDMEVYVELLHRRAAQFQGQSAGRGGQETGNVSGSSNRVIGDVVNCRMPLPLRN